MARSGSASEAETIVEARIDALDDDAAGRAAGADGRPLIAAGVLPGERVRVRVEHEGRAARYARLETVLEPSPDRVESVCPHFLACGGCDLLHASMAAQHVFKRQRVATALGLPLERVEGVVASPDALGYRALAKAVIGRDPSGRVLLGSYKTRSHDVVDMAGCAVHLPAAEDLLQAIRAHFDAGAEVGDLRYVLVRAARDPIQMVVTLVARSADSVHARQIAALLATRPGVVEVVLSVNAEEGDRLLGTGAPVLLFSRGPAIDLLGELPQHLGALAFVQVNPGAAARLYEAAAALLAPSGQAVLELYAGSGGLSLAVLRAGASRLTSVESEASAVRSAESAAAQLGIQDRLDARAGAVGDMLPALADGARLIAVNPPRKGLGPAVVEQLAKRSIDRLVYVSCNPASLARDLQQLGALRPELALSRVVPVDLFPQTRHVEVVALLG